MSAPNVLGYALAAVAQWVVVQTGRRGWAWLAWMIRSKDSLFSHCSLTTTNRPQPTRTIQSAGLPPPAAAMAVPSFCVHWALCDELCSVLPVLPLCLLGDGCVGCRSLRVGGEAASENAPSLSPFPSGISAAFLTSPL